MKSLSFVIFLILNYLQVLSQTLPDVFKLQTGKTVKSKKEWYKKRKPEIIKLFTQEVYGKIPNNTVFKATFQVLESEKLVLEGKAYRQQVRAIYENLKKETISVDLMMYYPISAKNKAVPVFTLLNYGNHTLSEDTTIFLSASKMYQIEQKRASYIRRFPIEQIVNQGFGLVTACYEDFMPDKRSAIGNFAQQFYGVHPDSTGCVAIWAWGYSRMVDFALSQPFFDKKKIAAVGHSRTGKTALWAAANDERIAYAFVNESGNTGAKLNYHLNPQAESIEKINSIFPHWFCLNYKKYNFKDTELPFDQHWLLACVAPQRLYVANADDDIWCDPEGEFLAMKEAEKVYQFLGLKTQLPKQMPSIGQPTSQGYLGYHYRKGKHDLLLEDWENFMKFMNAK